MQKFLTIIVPTYNMEKYLDKCLSSLIVGDQDCDYMLHLEVLVINDGSTDRSSEIAHAYEILYPKTFKVIDKENGNYGSCINTALRIAKGKYVKTLDADDFLETDKLGDFLTLLASKDADAFVNFVLTNPLNGNPKCLFGMQRTDLAFYKVNTSFTLKDLVDNKINHPVIHNITFRTQLLRDINYKQIEGIFYSDSQLLFIPMTHVKTIEVFPFILYNYTIERKGQSVSYENKTLNFHDFISLFKVLYRELINFRGSQIRKRYLENFFYGELSSIYMAGILGRDYGSQNILRLDNELRMINAPMMEVMDLCRVPIVGFHITVGYWRKHHEKLWFSLSLRLIPLFLRLYWKIRSQLKSSSPWPRHRREIGM